MISSSLYGGIWLLPAFMASYILRRPGTALLVSLLYSLVQVPFNPYGISVLLGGLIGGIAYELPFLFTRYRHYHLTFLLLIGTSASHGRTIFSSAASGWPAR
ncbi:MAG: ECF transporter S component [Oscillochloris sp.]|nr:ECF transporter S component [Oscillochloris sp.]